MVLEPNLYKFQLLKQTNSDFNNSSFPLAGRRDADVEARSERRPDLLHGVPRDKLRLAEVGDQKVSERNLFSLRFSRPGVKLITLFRFATNNYNLVNGKNRNIFEICFIQLKRIVLGFSSRLQVI